MRSSRHRHRPDDERGAAAVEFALVLTPLLMLLFGLITAALAYNEAISMTNAVREGARFGATTKYDPSTPTTWAPTVQTRTAQLAFGNMVAADVCVQLVKTGNATPVAASSCSLTSTSPIAPSGEAAGTCLVKVWAERPATINIGVAQWDITLHRQAVARYERPC